MTYKYFMVANNESEVKKIWSAFVDLGVNPADIYVARYQGNDGKYHRKVFVFEDDLEV